MAGATGLEPATSGVTGRRSNQLSYAPAASTEARHSYPSLRGVSSTPAEAPSSGELPRHFDHSAGSLRRARRSMRQPSPVGASRSTAPSR